MKTILLSEKYEAKNNPPAKINNNIDNIGPAKTNRTTPTTFLTHPAQRQSQSEGNKSPWQWQKL